MKNPFSRTIKGAEGSMRGFGGVFRSKYIELILAVGLFILLDSGVLILNFYTSYQIANDAHAIQLASRMGTLSQSLLQQLYQVRDDADDLEGKYAESIDIFARSYKLFDETLDAFIYGGDLIGVGQGQDALLKDTAYRDTSAHLLKQAEDIWKVYRLNVKPIVYADFSDAGREEIVEAATAAIGYARQQNDKLQELMEAFANAVEGVAIRKAERLRTIQSVGIGLAVINFFLILFHFLKRLSNSDALVEKSRKETEDILENVNEGLFLLDKEYIIGSQHSKSLHALFKDDKLAGQNFIELLRPLVTEKTLETVQDYTEILFSPRVNESLVADLNPLKQVEITLTADGADFDTRYFSFQFSRVYDKNCFDMLLVTVKDISDQVRLAEQLKAANEKAGKEIDMLLAIIHVENNMLTEFIRITEDGLNNVNTILKKPAKTADSLKSKLETIFRIAHKLKGDSTMVGLEFVEEKFHSLEAAIVALKEKQTLSGEDFLPLVVQLNQLMSDFTIIGSLQKKMSAVDLSGIHNGPVLPVAATSPEIPAESTPEVAWKNQLSTLVDRVGTDYGKRAVLDLNEFNAALLSDEQVEPVKDIIVQSLRNAIAHGLEIPESRERAGKPREGNLKVELMHNGSGLQLTIRDDGQGIDLDKIKAVALAKGLATESQLSAWHPSRLLSLIFRQGFTTAEEGGMHAGRGVGMDLIRSRLDALNGKSRVRFQAGRYTEFLFTFGEEGTVVQS